MLYSREKKIGTHNEKPHTSRILHGDREKNRHDNINNNILYYIMYVARLRRLLCDDGIAA